MPATAPPFNINRKLGIYPVLQYYGGSGDHTAAFAAALAAAGAAGGGEVTWPGGTYTIDFGVIPSSKIAVSGRGTTLLKRIGGTNTYLIAGASGVSDCRVEGLTLDGQNTLQTGFDPDIYNAQPSPSTVDSSLIYFTLGSRNVVEDVVCTRSGGAGVFLKGSTYASLRNVKADHNRFGGIALYPDSGLTSGCDWSEVIGGAATSNYCDGLRVSGCNNVSIQGWKGILNGQLAGANQGNEGGGFAAVYIEAALGILISGCHASGNTLRGMDFAATSTVTVTNCLITDHANGGILLSDGGECLVSGNTIINPGGNWGGIIIRGSRHKVVDNKCYRQNGIYNTYSGAQGKWGICNYDDGAAGVNCDIRGNTCLGNSIAQISAAVLAQGTNSFANNTLT